MIKNLIAQGYKQVPDLWNPDQKADCVVISDGGITAAMGVGVAGKVQGRFPMHKHKGAATPGAQNKWFFQLRINERNQASMKIVIGITSNKVGTKFQ